MSKLAVLLMAYGTPGSEDEVEAYLTDIRRGQKPRPEILEELKERYRKIGCHSPLLEITKAQASTLEHALSSNGIYGKVYVGMRHWHPYIHEVIPQIASDGHTKIVAIALAPHYSNISVGGYRQILEKATAAYPQLHVDFVESWYDNPLFHLAVAERIEGALKEFDDPKAESVQLIFTAHSLPERILEQNDPYPKQLRASCLGVANLLGISNWLFAYQSAGQTDDKWLGPDILETLQELSEETNRSTRNVLVAPIGFVADHLEILYDIDIEAQLFARAHNLTLRRTDSLNASSAFISALADIVRQRAGT